jgi:tRNA modification GTPase
MNASPTPTRAAIVTPKGRGAVACIAVAGPQAIAVVESLFRSASTRRVADQPLERILYGTWASTGEEIIVVRRSESNIEVHCHGGAAAAEAILASLAAAGSATVEWPEFIASAESSPIRAAAQVALAACTTQRTATILLDQYRGALDNTIKRVIKQLASGAMAHAVTGLNELLTWADFGQHLTTPWRVVIAGPPNAGKSTLINALVGYERAIVFDQPGTTRDVVTAGAAIDGWPIELADTAGLRNGGDTLEQAGAVRARDALQSADLAILVFDITQPWSQADKCLAGEHPNALVVYNKCDLLADERPVTQRPAHGLAGLLASAKTGMNLPILCQHIARKLVPRIPAAGSAIPFTAEQTAAIRSALACAEAGQSHEPTSILARLVATERPQ